MATKTQVRRAVEKANGTWDTLGDVESLDAPAFHVWKATGNHSIAVVYDLDPGQRASDRWEQYLEDVRFGTEPCSTPDCDMCAEKTDELQKDQTA